jgi:hypothetical protein
MEQMVAAGLLPLHYLSAMAQMTESSGPVSVDDLDTVGNPIPATLDLISYFTGSATQQMNDATSIVADSITGVDSFAADIRKPVDIGSYIFGLGLQQSFSSSGQSLTTTEGVVIGFDPTSTVLQFGPFLTVAPGMTSSFAPQASNALAGSFGRGNVPNGFFGTSSTGTLSAGAIDTLSIDYTFNSSYSGAALGLAPGQPSYPAFSYTNTSETYGVSALTTIDGGRSMEGLYQWLFRISQDPTVDFFNR